MSNKYLTAADVEAMTGIKEKTLANWRAQGKGPGFFKIGKAIRYSIEELDRWIQAHRVRTVDSL